MRMRLPLLDEARNDGNDSGNEVLEERRGPRRRCALREGVLREGALRVPRGFRVLEVREGVLRVREEALRASVDLRCPSPAFGRFRGAGLRPEPRAFMTIPSSRTTSSRL